MSASIDDETLTRLLEQLRPVCFDLEGRLHFIELPDPREIAYTWSPVLGERASGLVEIARFPTVHSYGAPALFKPTLAEVLAQLPDPLPEGAAAFTTFTDEVGFTDGHRQHLAVSALFAVATPASRSQDLREALGA